MQKHLKQPSFEAQKLEQVAEMLNIPVHVLHFWVRKFGCFSTQKVQANQTSLSAHDIMIARGLHHLLFVEKQTIKYVQTILQQKGTAFVIAAPSQSNMPPPAPASSAPLIENTSLEDARQHLEKSGKLNELRGMIGGVNRFLEQVGSTIEETPSAVSPSPSSIAENESEEEDEDDYLPAGSPIAYRSDVFFTDDSSKNEEAHTHNSPPPSAAIDKQPSLTRTKPVKPQKPSALEKKVSHAKPIPPTEEKEILKEATENVCDPAQKHLLRACLHKIEILKRDMQHTQKIVNEALRVLGYGGFSDAYADYDTISTKIDA